MAEAADAPSVRYQTLRRLAVGGMGEIFLARERGRLGFSRLVVIKRMLPELARRRDFVDMFVDEARIVGHLSHPNICQILELGEEEGVPFLALEYVRGDSLSGIWDRAHANGSSVPRAVTLRILADTAWALHYAHEACDADGRPLNVIHRDISPHNVMVSFFGDIKLMDFGIARADNRMHRTDTGKVKGKIAYMAPEQLRGQPLDRRADVFAVGVMLWELTLSRRLFGGGSEVETLQKAIACDVPRPRTIDPTYPEELEAIVMRALASNRDARTATAGELAEALRTQLARLGGAERADLAALMTRLYPEESAAGDEVIPTLSWIEPVDTETHERSPDEASAVAPRPTVPLKTPTPANDAGVLVPRQTAPMRTPHADEKPRQAPEHPRAAAGDPRTAAQLLGNAAGDLRPTLPLRTPDADIDARPTLPQRATGTANDARPTPPQRATGAVNDARPALPQPATGTANDARPTLPQRAMGIAGDSQPAEASSIPSASAAPSRRGRWGLVAAAVFMIAAAGIAVVLATRGNTPRSGDIAGTDGSSAHEATGGTASTIASSTAATGSATTTGASTNVATHDAAKGTPATSRGATENGATGTGLAGNGATDNVATGNSAAGTAATGNAATDSAATGVASAGIATSRGHGPAAGNGATRHGGGTHGSAVATSHTSASSSSGTGSASPDHGGTSTGGGPVSTTSGTSGSASQSSGAAPATKMMGTLAVASDQTGVVSIDGVRAKSTPYQTDLPAGDHRVEVELEEGAGTLRASARVVAGSKTKCRAEKGALACVVSPR